MDQRQAKRLIDEKIAVTPQRVVIAKAIILEASANESRSSNLIDAVLHANSIEMPDKVVLHSSADPLPAITATAEALSWRVAAAEAILSLIHSDVLVSLADAQHSSPRLPWTTFVPGGSGESSGWAFDELYIPVPASVRRAPSLAASENQFLAEPDLYLNTLGITNMHAELQAAFREAVKCFRHDLFTAAITMLGKASEGAWLELGASLLGVVSSSRQQTVAKQRQKLEDPMTGTSKKIEAVLQIFGHQDILGQLADSSGIGLQELRSVNVWSDAVRDSRNTIHFGVTPATPNTYEKLAALLVGAVPHMRVLYKLKEAADASASTART